MRLHEEAHWLMLEERWRVSESREVIDLERPWSMESGCPPSALTEGDIADSRAFTSTGLSTPRA